MSDSAAHIEIRFHSSILLSTLAQSLSYLRSRYVILRYDCLDRAVCYYQNAAGDILADMLAAHDILKR